MLGTGCSGDICLEWFSIYSWHSDNWVSQTAVGKHHRLCDLTALPCSQTLPVTGLMPCLPLSFRVVTQYTDFGIRLAIWASSYDAMIFLLLFNHTDYSKESVFCPPEDPAFLLQHLLYFFKINVMVDSWAYITKGLILPHENCKHSEQKVLRWLRKDGLGDLSKIYFTAFWVL